MEIGIPFDVFFLWSAIQNPSASGVVGNWLVSP